MTDKQIIIDGVDVSGCECIIEDYQRANNFEGRYEHIKNVCELGERGAEYYNLFCKDNPNCYYKQLKRKEQECEGLKEDNATLFDKAMETRKENTALQVELDQLKAELETLQQLKDEDSLRVTQLATECSRLSIANVNLKSMFYNTVNLKLVKWKIYSNVNKLLKR